MLLIVCYGFGQQDIYAVSSVRRYTLLTVKLPQNFVNHFDLHHLADKTLSYLFQGNVTLQKTCKAFSIVPLDGQTLLVPEHLQPSDNQVRFGYHMHLWSIHSER